MIFDSGSRGYELILDEGQLRWSLIHFWPGNAVSIRALDPLPDPDHLRALAAARNHLADAHRVVDGPCPALDLFAETGDPRYLEDPRAIKPNDTGLKAYDVLVAQRSGDPAAVEAAKEALTLAEAQRLNSIPGDRVFTAQQIRRNVLGEIKELRAKTEALKSGCVMTRRLVKPTIESAIACLRLDATAGTRAAMDDAATGVQATSERSPRLDTADASTSSSMAPQRSSRSTGPHQHQPIPPSAAAARAPVFNARAGTPHTPADSSYRESLRTPTDESFGTSGVRTEDLPETFRTAMDGLGFSSTLRKSAAVLVAEAEADAAKRSLASAAKKALASIMDSPAGGGKHR